MYDVPNKYRSADGCWIAVVRYPVGLHQPAHAHPFASISLVLRGGVREDVGHETVHGGVLDLVVKPAGTRHENLYLEADTTLVQVVPAEESLRQWLEAGCPLERWAWSDGAPAARALLRLARLAGSGPDRTEESMQSVVDDVIAALDRPGDGLAVGSPPRWLRRAREGLDGEDPPRISDLARDAGVHRVHFSREFRRHYGVSPTEYRLRARLRVASRAVVTAGRSLSASAWQAGFADQAHMNREFKQRLGLTPLDFRRLVGTGTRPA